MDNAIAKKTRRPSSRQAILEAAFALSAEEGAGHLTLEAVAARAGISKGGLLYNFPTKNALLGAMVEESLAAVMAVLETKEGEGLTPSDIIRAVFDCRFAWVSSAIADRSGHGILAGMAEQPAMLEPVRRFHKAVWDKLKAVTADPDGLWLVWSASEGLLCSEMFGITPVSAAERMRMIERLTREVDRLLAPGA